jgi:hypothetical protein
MGSRPGRRLSPAAGTYGNVFDGFEVTDSLPIPRLKSVFAAMENMTLGALSVSERTVPLGEPERGRCANLETPPFCVGRD